MENKMNSWKKTFYIISAGQAFSVLGSSVVQFAIIWWLTVKTNSAIVLSVASIAGFLPHAILGPFIGAVVDRHSRKFIMIVADLCIAAVTFVLIIIFFVGEPPVGIIYAALALRSLGSSFHTPAMQASIPMIVPEEKLTWAAGITQMIQSVSLILGPALAGLMLGMFEVQYVMLIDVLGAVIATITLLAIKIKDPVKSDEDMNNKGILREIGYGIKSLMSYKGLFVLTIISSIYMVIYIPVGSLFPLMVRGHFQGGAFHASTVEAAFAAGMLIGSPVLGAIGAKLNRITIISLSILIMGAALIVSGLLPVGAFIAFVILTALMGFSSPLFAGSYFALLQSKIDPSILGRVMGVINSMMLIASPVGLVVAGPGAEIIGIARWFLLSGILILILGMACILNISIKSIEN
ncbi:enterobactin exporter EntS [Oxobacter pfennigii]|uniref:Enterobactin exporter EntS n=1 Tax=Oxobacter pfennigii TaxID=36849 RepID=A0A0P8WQF2_9CLOT|nr:MFS transporter [Oxobacter pfennigii]KPU44780.1 enterobactin exporter EntS [Oxobacter pfennigii]